MAVVTQPALTSDKGVIITCGIRTPLDRCAMVFPVATDDNAITASAMCAMAVDDFVTNIVSEICDCLNDTAFVSFVQGEGMDNGLIPARIDFSDTDHQGTRGTGQETSQVAALMIYYQDPAQVVPPHRIGVAKNFIPGIADDDVVGDTIATALALSMEGLLTDLAGGYQTGLTTGKKWYRVLAAPRPRGTAVTLKNVKVAVPRLYTGTQRRRLIPHN